MKKIMFNDHFGLTDDVIEGRKTMTRRIIGLCDKVESYIDIKGCCCCNTYDNKIYSGTTKSKYKIGEVVAVAQSYLDIKGRNTLYRPDDWQEIEKAHGKQMHLIAGTSNKMFVRADLMPHRIRITNIKVERMQDISDEDCRKEGIVPFKWRQYLEQDINDFGPQKYKDWRVYTLTKFLDSLSYNTDEREPDEYMAKTPQVAFAVLIFKLMSRKIWEQNPFVFAYEFELVR